MGGDGGTISSNRTYLRGAGKACHTADHPSNALKRAKLEETERAKLILSTCAVSGAVLDLSPVTAKKNNGNGGGGGGGGVSAIDLVTCPYGKLYKREKVLEALLRRSQTGGGGGIDEEETGLGTHIRGMKDLHPVRFHVTKLSSSSPPSSGGAATKNGQKDQYVATCPITGSEIGSGNVPSFVIVRTKKDKKKAAAAAAGSNGGEDDDEVGRNPNVLSERAIKEMGVQGLQAEYGPFEEKDMIRLAPPSAGGVFEDIRSRWEGRMEEERLAKLKKKKDKKRKRGGGDAAEQKAITQPSPSSNKPAESNKPSKNNHTSNGHGRRDNNQGGKKKSAVDEARSTVQSAVANNAVLSNLFGTDKKKKHQSEKEKRDALFTRNC